MRNHFLLVLAFFVSCNVLAQSPKYEFRAAWLATVQNIDWPDIENDRTATEQKQALTAIFDKYAAGNMHACCLQVRSLSDAMYNSSYDIAQREQFLAASAILSPCFTSSAL